MKKLVVLLILLSIVLAGCVGQNEKSGNTKKTDSIDSVSPNSAPNSNPSNGYKDPNWCQKGTTFSQKSPQGTMQSKINGITTYKGREVCEAEATYDQGSMLFYFSQDGKFQSEILKDPNGKVLYEQTNGQ